MDWNGIDLEAMTEQISQLISTWGIKVLGAIAVLVIGFIMAKMCAGWARGGMRRAKVDETLVPFLAKLVYYLILSFVIIAALRLFGVETTSFVAVLGAGTLAVGLALQGTLSNFSSGVMLLLFRPFRVGDFVSAADAEGTVVEVGVFSTTLDTLDNIHIVIPNGAIWGSKILNFTANPKRRNDMAIGISYGDDIDKAKTIIRDTLMADDRVMKDPEPLIAVEGLGESSVDLLVGPWCDPAHYWDLRFDMLQRIKEALDRGGVTIPFPQRDVHLFQK